ncbi:MAG: rhomboid family intramembrane serine protease [Deltaproteobacteria bacterium]|nr:rhomboid family intramembrane serine protease [Deltaproteobacteria bacterium]
MAYPPDALIVIAGTDNGAEAQSWNLTLSAISLPHRVVDRREELLPFSEGAAAHDEWPERFCLVVSSEDADRALAVIDAQSEEELARKKDVQAMASEAQHRTRPGIAALGTLALNALLILVFLRTPGFRSDVSLKLRVDAERIFAGEWWRIFGGPLLHGDLGHLMSNVSFLLPLGYFCAVRLGVGHFVFGFVTSAALGNVASVLWHGAPFFQVGASGGVFGVLGVLVGAAIYAASQRSDPRYRRRAVLGAALAYLGLTAFGATIEELRTMPRLLPVSTPDMAAHVFGFLAGVLVGVVGERTKTRRDAWLFVVAAAVVMGALWAAR